MALFNWFGNKPEEKEQLIPEVIDTTQEQSNGFDSTVESDEEKKTL